MSTSLGSQERELEGNLGVNKKNNRKVTLVQIKPIISSLFGSFRRQGLDNVDFHFHILSAPDQSQNHGMVEVGKDLKSHLFHNTHTADKSELIHLLLLPELQKNPVKR